MLERVENIIVAVDFSDVSVRVVQEAGHLAKTLGSKIHLIHVEDTEKTMTGFDAGSDEQAQGPERQSGGLLGMLQKHEDALRAQGVEVDAVLKHGDPIEKLVGAAKSIPADLLFIGTHGHGAVYHLIAGSVGEGILRKSPCPVLVIRSENYGK